MASVHIGRTPRAVAGPKPTVVQRSKAVTSMAAGWNTRSASSRDVSDNTLDHTEPVTASAPAEDEPLVELRCAGPVFHGDQVLLLQRPDRGDWVLLGGRPHSHQSMASCARRETREETGLDVHPNRCGLIVEVNDPIPRRRLVELVFVAEHVDAAGPLATEPGRWVPWAGFDELRGLNLRPPIAGYLPDLAYRRGASGQYLGKVWRPEPDAP